MKFTQLMLDKLNKYVFNSFHTIGLFENVNDERQCKILKPYHECPISFHLHRKARINGFSVFDEDGTELVYGCFDEALNLENGDVFVLRQIDLTFAFGSTDGSTVLTDRY